MRYASDSSGPTLVSKRITIVGVAAVEGDMVCTTKTRDDSKTNFIFSISAPKLHTALLKISLTALMHHNRSLV
jgi:hypothetical protein